MRERKLQRRGRERNAARRGEIFERRYASDDVRRRRRVVEVSDLSDRGVCASGEDARVERAAGHDARPALYAQRKQFRQRTLIEQRVASGEQDHVEIRMTQRVEADRNTVDANAVRADDAGALQIRERRQAAVEEGAKVAFEVGAVGRAVEIVHVDEVDAILAQTPPAVGERTEDAVARVVVRLRERQPIDVPVLIPGRRRVGHEDPADLCREQERIARNVVQRRADPLLGQSITVVGRRVEIADSAAPCVPHELDGVRVGKRREQVAERRAAERERSAA